MDANIANFSIPSAAAIAGLVPAIAAAQQQQWSLAIQALQSLLAESSRDDWPALSESVLAIALQVLRAGDFAQCWEAAKLLARLGTQAIAPVAAAITDPEATWETRWFAARILSEFDDPDAILALAALLKDEDEELAEMAAQSLARIGPASIPVLVLVLAEESRRSLAVQVLGCLCHPDVIEPLLGVIADPSPTIRATAIAALGSFRDCRIPPMLLSALNDLAAAPRREAVIALGRRRDLLADWNLVQALQPRLHDIQLEICQQAAVSLGRLGGDRAAEALFSAFASAPERLQAAIVQALGWIETPQSLAYLGQLLLESQPAIAQEIIAVLGRQASPALKQQAAEILGDFFPRAADTSARLRQEIATAWGQLGGTTAIAFLEQLSSDPDLAVQWHARAALKKIIALV
ncbi:MAG: HEAT repeat domain-containing protein [Chloroflexaceae bacterium]|nr:HEAT repeat domain-containing protein [Chloroflexaceae bacterium]